MGDLPPVLGFSSLVEHYLGEKLALIYAKNQPAYQRWFSRSTQRISAEQGRDKLQHYMPELLATYDGLCHALGGDEQTGQFLSLYNPPVFRAGCSQAGKSHHIVELVRNYDFPAQLCDRFLLHTNWNGTKVIAMADCLWGILDGMNEHGLAVSLAYGGRHRHGNGFAITLVLRYILEFCRSTDEAVAVLKRVPIHMAYNVTLVDCTGNIKTVLLCPGEEVQVTSVSFATNHQQGGAIDDIDAIADSYVREQYLSTCLSDPRQADSSLVSIFLQSPLMRKSSEWHGWGTLYTARYLPLSGTVELYWPNGQVLSQRFNHFVESDISVGSPAYL